MKTAVLHISGLFEVTPNQLFQHLQHDIERQNYRYTYAPLFLDGQFGSYPFIEEMQRIQKMVDECNPVLIVAHSLGAYIAMQLDARCPLVLLDPSLAIAEIVEQNLSEKNGILAYEDGTRHVILSKGFVASLAETPSIETICQSSHGRDVYVIGAGHGGHKVAEQYVAQITRASYVFLPNANHNFSEEHDRNEILKLIKKWLGTMPSRARGETHIKSL